MESDLIARVLAFDESGYLLEHRAAFFPSGQSRPEGHGDTILDEHHLCGGGYPTRHGITVSNLYLISDGMGPAAKYAVQERFAALCELLAGKLDGLGYEILDDVYDPLHRWLLAIHVLTQRQRESVHRGRKTRHGAHDGKYPVVPCCSRVSPVGAISAAALDALTSTRCDPMVEEGVPTLRLSITTDPPQAILDGTPFVITAKWARFLAAAVAANGAPVSMADFDLRSRDLEAKSFPQALRDLMESQPGSGTRIPRERLLA